jgi:uncharacterized membrane protein
MAAEFPGPGRLRVTSIDVLRGVVMVLMALDHVRVYSGVPAGGPTAGVFLTRWITHFCAPAFFFLAGTSAYLRGAGTPSGAGLSRWLVTRGLVLVALELTFVRLAWTFNLDWAHYMLAGVLWALGWSVVALAGLVRLPARAIAVVGLAIVSGHHALPQLMGARQEAALEGAFGPLLRVLYFGGGVAVGGPEPNLFVLYSLIPWIGVMAAGYAFGSLMTRAPSERSQSCLRLGMAAVGAFLLLRATQAYGDRPWLPAAGEEPWAPTWILFLATTKYPASLQFLLMTLGPTLLALAAVDRARDRVTGWLAVVGRTPMFFYLLHIPLIHVAAIVVAAVRTPKDLGWLFGNHPLLPPPVPDGYTWPLVLVYGVALFVSVMLYRPCRWYAKAKAERRWGWTAYI